MREAFNKLLGLKISNKTSRSANRGAMSIPAESQESRPHSIEDNSDNGTRRQLVQVVLRDFLRTHGVPPGWVECQMLVVNSRSKGQGMYVRLVMRHWNLQLLTHMVAFQKGLLAAISDFEPEAPNWLHGLSWEFDPAVSCPHPDMPDPSVWLGGPAGQPADATGIMSEPEDDMLKDLQDLQRMFAARDATAQLGSDSAPLDFQSTQPGETSSSPADRRPR